MFNKVKKEFQYGQHHAFLETGYLARQADGAVVVGMGDTLVLATVVARREANPGQDFFPLTVDYVEKSYSAGRIPGGFFKREGRATEKEILTSRLIDRPLRPLFPEGFLNEVQVIVTVLSFDPEVDPDVPAMIAASAALSISGIPFMGPIGAARVGFVDNAYVLNPTRTQLKDSALDLIVAGSAEAILMVESAAKELPESIMLGAVTFGQEGLQSCIAAITALAAEAAKPDWSWEPPQLPVAFIDQLTAVAQDKIIEAYSLVNKPERYARLKAIYTEMEAHFCDDEDLCHLKTQFSALQSRLVRSRVLAGEARIDGRDTRTVRPIHIHLGLLPRAHGSAVFTRGETQAVVITTLGTEGDSQIVDALNGESRDHFIFHYNMPPFATGETGRLAVPKRREVGHGNLAKRALIPLLPDRKDFPYTLRVVSEITESNGSSSMASVCGACLSLMDAGVPLKSHVAGVAMGLIKEGNKFAILTDILGDEDHLGDMDFKVAGTVKGITALQMDIKITGITQEIMEIALMQAKSGRMHILDLMQSALCDSREELSLFAPRMERMQVNPEKIHLVIGKGGATIKSLTEEDGTSIDIHEDGTLTIAAASFSAIEQVKSKIQLLTAEVEANKVYEGKVIKIFDFGVVIDILPGRDGLLHVSQLVKQRGQSVSDLFKEGQAVRVKVIGFDEKGRPRLSTKEIDEVQGPVTETPAT